MNWKWRVDLLVTGALLAAAGVFLGGSAIAVGISEQAYARQIGVLSTSADEDDRLPPELVPSDHGVGGLTTESVRYLGSHEGLAFWAARDRSGNLCLVAFDDGHKTGGTSCGTAEQIASDALGFMLTNEDKTGFEAFLLPDGYLVRDLPSPWIRVGSNVVLVDHSQESEPEFRITSAETGAEVVVRRFPDTIEVVIPHEG